MPKERVMDESKNHSILLNPRMSMKLNSKEAWKNKLTLTHGKRVEMHKEIDMDVLM